MIFDHFKVFLNIYILFFIYFKQEVTTFRCERFNS